MITAEKARIPSTKLAFTVLIIFSFLVPNAFASGRAQNRAQCIVGTWSGERVVVNRLGKQLVWAEFVIEVVESGTIKGTSSWTLLEGAGGDSETEIVAGDTEEVFGAVGRRGREFYLAESLEPGILLGTMIGRNRMEVVLIQSGAWPVAGASVLKREGRASAACIKSRVR